MKFISPMKVLASKRKMLRLNLNEYRNTHYRILNNAKINYKEVMKKQIQKAKRLGKALFVYTVYPGSKRSFDIGNICCIHEKFFEDAFVELGKLEDDNANFLPLVVYMYGGIDKDNPRVDIEAMELNRESIDKVVEMMYNIIEEVDDEQV
jgi:hypothetical protein